MYNQAFRPLCFLDLDDNFADDFRNKVCAVVEELPLLIDCSFLHGSRHPIHVPLRNSRGWVCRSYAYFCLFAAIPRFSLTIWKAWWSWSCCLLDEIAASLDIPITIRRWSVCEICQNPSSYASSRWVWNWCSHIKRCNRMRLRKMTVPILMVICNPLEYGSSEHSVEPFNISVYRKFVHRSVDFVDRPYMENFDKKGAFIINPLWGSDMVLHDRWRHWSRSIW